MDSSVIVEALTSVATSMKGAINDIMPVALGVTGLGMACKAGIRFFKSIAKA